MNNPYLTLVMLDQIQLDLAPPNHLNHNLDYGQSHLSTQPILAQQLIGDYDVIGDLRGSYDNFVESGQIWALLIGLFFGYIFKSFTSY